MHRVRQPAANLVEILFIFVCTAALFNAQSTRADTWTTDSSGMNTYRYLHAAVPLLDGRVLIVGGGNNGFISPSQIYDSVSESWMTAGAPRVDRGMHSATLLTDGRVLVTGGNRTGVGALSSTEMFDPGTNTWSEVASLSEARLAHSATRLADGRVLIAGGYSKFNPSVNLYSTIAGVEIYNAATNQWSRAASMRRARAGHTATLLPDGRVLISGGDRGSSSTSSAEIYNPATNTWSLIASMTSSRAYHTATALADGRVLVVGGRTFTRNIERLNTLSSTEIYNPVANSWSPAGSLSEARAFHASLLTLEGAVMVVGGDADGNSLFTVERYNPVSNSWASIAPLNVTRANHTVTQLFTGKVLVTGGYGGPISSGTGALQSAEVYDPAPNNRWNETASMSIARAFHTATRLQDGRVLVAGGDDGNHSLLSVELFDSTIDGWISGGSLNVARANHTATLLTDGRVLLVGGVGASGEALFTAEIFDPATTSWSMAGSMLEPRAFHSATLLLDGRVMIAGGSNGVSSLSSVEIYNPASNTWTSAAPMSVPRAGHGAAILSNRSLGQVLVFGGSDGQNALSTAAIYDPVTNGWSPAGSMHWPRMFFAATASEVVFVTGGTNGFGSFSDVDKYEPPRIDGWLGGGSMSMARTFHTLTSLPDGRLLVTGGSAEIRGAQVIVPYTQEYNNSLLGDASWRTVASMNTPRLYHTATLLSDGRVLVVGGSADGVVGLSSAEIYSANQTVDLATTFFFINYGSEPITLNATATSGLPVSFQARGACSVAGNVLSILLPGQCTVTTTQEGNIAYNPAPPVVKTFTIGKAFPSIAITVGTFVYDGNPHGATAFAYGIGGVNDLLTPAVTITYQGVGYGPTTTPPIAIGNYSAVAAFAGNDLYNAGSRSDSLTIQPFDLPPETNITDGPGSVFVNSATFTWTGTDDHTPTGNLVYAYRLDPLEANFSAFSSSTVKVYANLPNGSYNFYVKAKDLGGNEDPTPAVRSLFVNSMSGYVPVTCFTSSLQTAVDAALPGDTLSVAGNCNENILVSNAKERITIEGVGNAVINGPDPDRPTINVRGKGVLIQGFTITGGSDGINVNRGSTAVLNRNYIHETLGRGIAVEGSSYAVVTASTIENNPGAAIVVAEKAAARIGFNSDLELVGGSGNQMRANGVGIVISDSSNARVSNNMITSNNGAGIVVLRDSQADLSSNNIGGNGSHGIEIAHRSMVQLGEDDGTTFYDTPNFSFVNNLGFGISCTTGSIVDGRQGFLNGTAGTKNFDGTCIDSLTP